MRQQEHGRDAFQATLRKAAAETEAPVCAWSSRLGVIALEPVQAVCHFPLATRGVECTRERTL